MLKYSRHGETFSLDPNTLSPESLAYLLQYGFAQSLQDSVAGRAKKVRDEGGTDDDVAVDELAAMQKRLDAIIAGSVGSGVRSPRDAFGAMQTKVTRDLLAAYAKSKGKKLPKQASDEYKALFDRFAGANADAIEKETKRRLEDQAGLGEIEDIF